MRTITVCVCTFRRPLLLKRLLNELERQETQDRFTFSVAVADNDSDESARFVVSECSEATQRTIVYQVEPRRNIALARNRVLEISDGEYIAFIDDDEFPDPLWLSSLLNACEKYNAAGVLGPVKPWFDHRPPSWIVKGKFFEREEHATGYELGMWQARTGNVLFRRSILVGEGAPFREEFGTAGEDIDFFRRMMEKGHRFVWCNEAVVHEVVPPERCTRAYLLKKSFLRASNFLQHPTDRTKNIVKSVVAVPMYAVLLPFILLLGQDYFMKYLVKFCDHVGRILALMRINLVCERDGM